MSTGPTSVWRYYESPMVSIWSTKTFHRFSNSHETFVSSTFQILSPSDRIPSLFFSISLNMLKNPSTWAYISPFSFDLSHLSEFLKVSSRCRARNVRIVSSLGTPFFHVGLPSDAIWDVMDFKESTPTANPLFAAKMRRSKITASSSASVSVSRDVFLLSVCLCTQIIILPYLRISFGPRKRKNI